MLRDMKSNEGVVLGLAPAARTNGTATGSAADLRNAVGVVAEFSFGAWTDGTHTPSLEESADGTTYTAVGTDDMQGTLAAVSGTDGQNQVQRVGYTGGSAYLRQKLVTASSTTGALSGAEIRTMLRNAS